MHFCVSVGVRRGDHTLRCGEGGGGGEERRGREGVRKDLRNYH